MDKKLVFGILLFAIVTLAISILMPGSRKVDSHPKLPWLVEVNQDGSTQVFGLTLNRSTINDARDLFSDAGSVSLFRSQQGEFSLEIYFKRIFLSGLRGDFIFLIQADEAMLQGFFDRGLRISRLGSGASKVELNEQDLHKVYQQPIDLITYIPGTDLDEPLIEARFGKPDEKITETSGTVHWLYPARGLDLAYNPDGNEVLQYIHPKNFERILRPLKSPEQNTPGQKML